MSRAPLSVVVPTRDRPAMLARCLEALRADLGAADEIVVADSASRDHAEIARIAASYGARVVRCERPGASLARNTGWQAASHELIGFVDDDVRVRPGWSAALVAGFAEADATQREPDESAAHAIAFVTGSIVLPPDQADAERPVATTTRLERTLLHPGLDGNLGASANLAVRREALQAVGGFDVTLGPGSWAASAEDLDLFDRLFRSGRRGSFEPAAGAEHDQWRTKPQLLALDWRYGKGMGVRLSRLAHWDRARARRLRHEALVAQGLRPIGRDLRHGYEFGALTVASRTLGTLIGLVVGRLHRSVVGTANAKEDGTP